MEPEVDTGQIIDVIRFKVEATDNVETLLQKTYKSQFDLFETILQIIDSNKTLTSSKEKWTRLPFTREQFKKLCELSPNMSKDEMKRIIRATNYRSWKPTLTINGFTFTLNDYE